MRLSDIKDWLHFCPCCSWSHCRIIFSPKRNPNEHTSEENPPKYILYVGNSFFYYNNSIHNHVLNLTRAADPANKDRYRATSVTISGSGFDWHDMESYFRPDGIGKYSFVEDNEIVFNKSGTQFDAVIIADCSQCT